MPHPVLGETQPVSHVKTVSSQPDGSTTTTLELHCKAVPGAVVRHNEKTTDEDGRVFNVGCWS